MSSATDSGCRTCTTPTLPCPVVSRMSRWSEHSEDIRALRRRAKDGPLSVESGSRDLLSASLSAALVKNDDAGKRSPGQARIEQSSTRRCGGGARVGRWCGGEDACTVHAKDIDNCLGPTIASAASGGVSGCGFSNATDTAAPDAANPAGLRFTTGLPWRMAARRSMPPIARRYAEAATLRTIQSLAPRSITGVNS